MNKMGYRKKLLPPYGKELLKHKMPSEIWLFLGPGAWRYAELHYFLGKAVLVMPEDKSPEDFNWPVQNFPILIFDLNKNANDEIFLKRLAWCLLACGAEIVRLVRVFYAAAVVAFYRDGQARKSRCY